MDKFADVQVGDIVVDGNGHKEIVTKVTRERFFTNRTPNFGYYRKDGRMYGTFRSGLDNLWIHKNLTAEERKKSMNMPRTNTINRDLTIEKYSKREWTKAKLVEVIANLQEQLDAEPEAVAVQCGYCGGAETFNSLSEAEEWIADDMTDNGHDASEYDIVAGKRLSVKKFKVELS